MGRKLFTFNPVRNSLGLTFHQQAVQYPTDYAAKFNRNLILSGKSAAGEEWSPAFLKCADAIASVRLANNPKTGIPDNEFGAATESAGKGGALSIASIDSYSPTALGGWTPGGNGVNAWAAYRLPEATLCDRYLVHTKQAEAPLGWRLEGSNTGLDEDWANVHQVDNTGEWVSAGEQKEFVIPPETRGA
ncbi:MAG: hypothetical protein LBR71_06705, partial [Synergistaceae bacterium]|nr:hypothetical protein [Synergistaceae bacterium]